MRHFVLGLVALASINVYAQEDVLRPNGRDASGGPSPSTRKQTEKGVWIIGPELGLNVNFFSSNVTGTFDNSPYNMYRSGNGLSLFGGLYVEYAFTKSMGVGARINYDVKHIGNTEESALIDCPDANTGTVPLADIKSSYNETVRYVSINPLFRWSPIDQLVVHIGPVASIAVGKITNTLTYSLPEDGTCRFNPGTAEESLEQSATTEADAAKSVRFGVDIGVGYRFALAPSIALVPRIGYQFMFTPYADNTTGVDDSRATSIGNRPIQQTDLSLTSLQASLGLWFTL